jgi:hypothetical protein
VKGGEGGRMKTIVLRTGGKQKEVRNKMRWVVQFYRLGFGLTKIPAQRKEEEQSSLRKSQKK